MNILNNFQKKSTDSEAEQMDDEIKVWNDPLGDDEDAFKGIVKHAGRQLKNYRALPVEKVVPDPDQPRKVKPEDPSLLELAESIREHGLMNPIHVRYVQVYDIYQIINGERRYWACRSLEMAEIPAIIFTEEEIKDEVNRAIKQLVDNLQREDLKPLEEADGYKKLIEVHKLTQREVAKKVGKSENNISETLLLNTLPDDIKQELLRVEVSAPKRFLIQLARQKDLKQQIFLWSRFLKTNEPSDSLIKAGRTDQGPKLHKVREFNLPSGWKIVMKFEKKKATIAEIGMALGDALRMLGGEGVADEPEDEEIPSIEG